MWKSNRNDIKKIVLLSAILFYGIGALLNTYVTEHFGYMPILSPPIKINDIVPSTHQIVIDDGSLIYWLVDRYYVSFGFMRSIFSIGDVFLWWGIIFFIWRIFLIDDATIKNHILNLRRKLKIGKQQNA